MTLSDLLPVTLDRKVTVGGIITLATIIITTSISWGVAMQKFGQMGDDVVEVRLAVEALELARFADNGRMVRVETLLEQILEEVKSRP